MTGSFKVQLINMGTRAAAFQAKLRCLHEYHLRLLHNVLPLPSGVDIANTIKYFSQTLLNQNYFLAVLKDVPNSPHQLIKDPSMDQTRMSAYPNLEYGNLYNALTMLLDVAPCIQYGQINFGKALIQCFCCILPFLDKDLIDNLPYLTSSTISVLPPALHQDVINALCYYILPFTITRQSSDEQECQACQSISSVIMMVFQYSNNPAHHCQLLECLMTLKHNVAKDILCVIAYGTAQSRSSAAKLLFYYWPAFDPNLFDRRGLLSKLTNDLVPFVCQREQCPNAGNAEAAKVCFDHGISIAYSPDCPPPIYLCIECANEIHREHANLTFGDILHPMQQVSMVCENKNCRSTEKSAFSICFSTECASYNGNHPIRYCAQCHGNRHNSRRGGDHVVHRSLPPAWIMEPEMQMYMVESVISLLREAKPVSFEPAGKDLSGLYADGKNGNGNGIQDNITIEERQLLGRYGIWLLVGRCTPNTDTPVEILGRLLSMLFHWFHVTAYSYDAAGQIESTIEKLKVEHVCQWLKEICRINYNTFISCLLPHPPEFSRVGGHWETLASRTSHLKEGLQRLICLVPYEVITSEIWDYVMPHWMEAITNDVAEKELQELKIVLSKILDPEMSPLGFDAKTMYNFVAIRFEKTTAKVQQQALHWLQILTKLEILIPLSQLFAMFGDGVRIMKSGVQHDLMKEKENKGHKAPAKEKENVHAPPRRSSISPVVEDDSGNTSAISDDEAPTNRPTEFTTDVEHNLTCCILMLDILLKQMELQDIEQHMGINTTVCENVSRLLKCMVTAARVGLSTHVCALKAGECAYCEASIMWHQLSSKLVQFMAPRNPVRPPDPPIVEVIEEEKTARKSPPENEKEKCRDMSLSMAPLPIPLGPLGGFAGIPFFPDDTGKIIIMAGPVPVVVPQPEPHSVGGVLVHMPHVCSTNDRARSNDIDLTRNVHATDEIMTATVETVSEQLDLAAIMPSEKVVTAVARSITLSDADVATATVQVAKPQLIGITDSERNESIIDENDDDTENGDDFWHTSVGKFKFSLDALPQSLQYIHQLLTEIPTIQKPDILYYILQCLNIMVLHGDALTKAVRDQRGFFIWCQENLLIKNLWDLCNAEYSHICQVGVPLLLHCITLPLGSDVFWRVIQEDFHNSDWRVRFTAVERVTVVTRFMDSTPLRSEVGLQTALATAFCHLIASMDDINVHVAQRSTLYLGTIHDYAIRSLLFCLESQYDLFIVDRPVVLQSLYQLHNSLSDRRVLTWDFFLNRFDTLFVEAQLNLEKSGDISYLRDLRNSENGSEILSMKIHKAREALSQSDTTGSMAKTLSASFGTKWPYKRTMSAPASMIPRQESKMEKEKEKIYSRQISAPILKRKTSRFGLGQLLTSSGTNNNTNQNIVSSSCQATATLAPITILNNNNLNNTNLNTSNSNLNSNIIITDNQNQNQGQHCYHDHLSPQTVHVHSNNSNYSNNNNNNSHNSSPQQQYHHNHHQLHQHQGQQLQQPLLQISIPSPPPPKSPLPQSISQQNSAHPSSPNPNVHVNNSSSFFSQSLNTIVQQQQHQQLLQQSSQKLPLGAGTGSYIGATSDGHIHSIGGAEDLSAIIHRIIDLEESDKETIHLLTFLLMQFMSRPDQAFPSEEKPMARTQSLVLKHLFLLLGHNQLEKTFHVTPSKLRSSAVFNAFIANLPQVLDQNHLIGWLILPSVLQVLLFAPNPTNTGLDSFQNLIYSYSLWYLEAHVRRNWLMSILVVLYKYQYTQPPYSAYINSAVRIVLNCLKAQFHQCKRIPTRTILDIQPISRSRDASQPSLGTDPDENRQESPPPSPMFPSEGTSGASRGKIPASSNFPLKPGSQPPFRKYHDSSIEADDTESELVAIPESDFSDSTMHGSSAPGSFDDPMHFDEVTTPLKPEILRNKTHVTTANLAAAHVALTTLKAAEHHDEKKDYSKKNQRSTKSSDVSLFKTGSKSNEPSSALATQMKCSVQEGVRMMVTPSMIMTAEAKEKAVLNPPVEIQRAVTVTQRIKSPDMAATSKMFANIASNHLKAIGALQGIVDTKLSPDGRPIQEVHPLIAKPPISAPIQSSIITNGTSKVNGMWSEQQPVLSKILGRQKKIVESTPASTPIGTSSSTSTNTDDSRSNSKMKKPFKSLEKTFGSPESPLSKMSVMPTPAEEISADIMDGLPKPKTISQLEFPTPERLLPIGEGVSSIVERVREGLNIPDISHLKQDSLDVSESTRDENSPSSRGVSPRKLIKQVALESPTNIHGDDLHTTILKNVTHNLDAKSNKPLAQSKDEFNHYGKARPKLRKIGPFAVDSQSIPDIRSRFAGSWPPQSEREYYEYEDEVGNNGHSDSDSKPSSSRVGDDCICSRCAECGSMIEEYSDEEIGFLIIILATFIHREPAMAAPFLPEILTCVSKFAMHSTFPWQCESTTHLPGGSQSVAHQFLRVVLHQLAPNGVFVQLFQTQAKIQVRRKYFKSIAQALLDFQELNPTSPIYLLCEALNTKKHLPVDILPVILRNMAEYLHSIPVDSGLGSTAWQQSVQGIETLFRQVILILPSLENPEQLLEIMVSILKVPGVSKAILDPFSKVLSFCVQNISLKHKVIYDLCTLSIRAFSKDRDKMLLCRQIIFELVQALKFKTNIPDSNLLLIVGFTLQDAGGALPAGVIEGLPDHLPVYTTNSADCMRQYMNDILDFLADFHTLSKIKNFKNGNSVNGLGEDTLGGVLKGAVAQYLALEMSRGNSRDNKAVSRYLPWLYNAPSSLQQGPKEFTDCVGHMRLLSWLIMGSLTHTSLQQRKCGPIVQHSGPQHFQLQHAVQTMSQPVPQEASCHIADHIQVIFAGFAEQSKTSVLHMSSLFHAFTLCQLWTVYLEQISYTSPHSSDAHNVTMGILFEFWAKVTPCILQLVSHSKVLSEMVNLHFISLLEALRETHSTVLGKLLPLWSPVLSSTTQLPGNLHVRLQSVRDCAPDLEEQQTSQSEALLKWLQRLQFKMGQIELQSSTATQFYSI